MTHSINTSGWFAQLVCSFRIMGLMMVMVGLYTLTVLAFAQVTNSDKADGSLVKNKEGVVVGSSLIAQDFSRADYFHPRPSAVGYNGAGSGGSNLSPNSPALHNRAKDMIMGFDMSDGKKMPVDLITASGSGLDPYISLDAALFQVERVSKKRNIPKAVLEQMLMSRAEHPYSFKREAPIINVLSVNMELDRLALK
jgi:K+-transporting ATPase ATPase C chain